MLLIGGAVGFMSGVLLMFFLLGLRVSEDRVIDLNGTLITHIRAEARARSTESFLQVPGSRA
jgi:hypothetical protein